MSVKEEYNGLPSFFRESSVNQRIMLVIIPHEDDEINLAGTVIYQARKSGIRVICAFLTNGDWKYPGLVRMKEAIKSLAVLGVEEEDILFLGYPDGGVHGERNVFVCGQKEVLEGRDGRKETYGMESHDDFSLQFRGHHQSYTWKGMVEDVKDVILCYRPSLILATDFDSHPDHRLCYLAFLSAMAEILSENKSYRPEVLMGFCYSTGFEGTKDFYGKHLLSSVINEQQIWNTAYETDNPPYEWKERVRFPVAEDCRSLLKYNIIFKSLCCHVSQKAPARAVRLVNGDQVFWRRRTNNLIYDGRVSVSSGDGKYLHDFRMMNVRDITEKKPVIEDYLWIPDSDDKEKWCRCDFDEPQNIEAVAFYGNIDEENRILKGKLTFSTGYSCIVGPFRKQGHENLITVPIQKDVQWVQFEILESKGIEAGISEWEILEKQEMPFSILQICVDDHFAYDWYIYPGEKPKISAYALGINGKLQWFLNGTPATLAEVNEKIGHLNPRFPFTPN
jgi:LmbE family N-acetylglucosaminyl deacetylase